MAAAASAPRRSTRVSHQPLSLAEEQAADVLSRLEERDVAAVLRSSLASSWDSDEEQSEAEAVEEAESSSSEQEEEKKDEAQEEEVGEWTSNLQDIAVPLPRLRHMQNRPPPFNITPLQLLQYFLPPQLMNEFAQHTNAAAPHDWRPTTAAELYAFLGTHLFMGIDHLPSIDMYWSAAYQHSTITSIFSRNRFKQLLRFFRVVPAPVDVAPRDPLPHVRALAEKLNQSFAAHFTPTEYLTLDEAMAAYKGRSSIKQYIPSKSHKWGYKIYCLASEDYLLHFEIYEGKEADPSERGATYDTVIRMVQPYQDQQLTLFTDNWFTSPTLTVALAERGIRLCGSVNRRRKGMPVIKQEDVNALSRGEWLQRQKDDMAVAVWKDRRTMWVLYNHCSPREVASLQRWSNAGEKISIGCPRAIHDYFYRARSVDVMNQLHYSYLLGRKARRCWPRLAWWLLDMCILNAFKLWSLRQQHASHLQFREELMHRLLEQYPDGRRSAPPREHPPVAGALAKDHFSVRAGVQRDCVICSHQPHHRQQSSFICQACKVHLCIGDCFSQYHA
jgi:hypothetical protein